MNNFDYKTLELFIKENEEFLKGARLQKIQQPTRQELIFVMRNLGETRKFYVNINPKNFHIAFMSKENEAKRYLTIPQKPPMFCMLLRKYIESSRIAKIEQPSGERILEFYFEIFSELGEKIYLCLSIELMGKHSNVILYNYDTNMIIGCMHNVGSDKSSVREIIGGLPYCYPPKKNNQIKSGLIEILDVKTNLNEQIDTHFAIIQEQEKINNLKLKLFGNTNLKLKKIKSTLQKLSKQEGSKQKADFARKKGDLIMANLFHLKDYQEEIEVLDYETNSPLMIKLDSQKTLKENANQFYKIYNKAKTAHLKTEEMVQKLNLDKKYYSEVLYSIETSEKMIDLFDIEAELGLSKELKPKSKSQILENIELEGFKIYIGKNNKQNDYIVSKLARPEDIWFHIHNQAGSHVLLRVESGQVVDDKIIFECAKLAKFHSLARNSSKVGIIYTRAKNLKKPPAANLGYVIYKGEKEIIVD